jgi:hypothetical protein
LKGKTMNFDTLPEMSETQAKAVRRWREYQDRKAPMIVRPTPADFPDADLHRAFLVVPLDATDFVMADFAFADDAQKWCVERGLPVVSA